MNLNETPEDAPEWWARWLDLTPEQIDAMADEYQREQIASAQSEQAQEQLRKDYRRG
jgi:Spy/CpxP family protein refolding chaperone